MALDDTTSGSILLEIWYFEVYTIFNLDILQLSEGFVTFHHRLQFWPLKQGFQLLARCILCYAARKWHRGKQPFLSPIECKIGRIGAIAVVPVQVRVEEVQPLIGETLEKSKLAQALLKKYRAYNFQEVNCTDEEGNSCDMIKFLVPQSFESDFPCQCSVEDVTFVVDHALPYSLPLSIPSRPPAEETRHDHWNKAACFRRSGKKGRRNQIVAKRGCPGSMNSAYKKVLFNVGAGKLIRLLSAIASLYSSLPMMLRTLLRLNILSSACPTLTCVITLKHSCLGQTSHRCQLLSERMRFRFSIFLKLKETMHNVSI